MGEPGGLPSVGSHRVGQDWSDLAAAAAAAAAWDYGKDFLAHPQGPENLKKILRMLESEPKLSPLWKMPQWGQGEFSLS